MPLTTRTNGSGGSNIIQASWFNDFMNLLTGVMSDQPVTINNGITAKQTTYTTPTAPTLALATGTALGIGAYTYAVAFKMGNGQTVSGTTAAITTTTGNQDVNLSSIPTGPAGTTGRIIYRSKVGTTSPLFTVTTIGDNTTTTFIDTVADASLGAQAPVHDSFGGYLLVQNQSGVNKAEIFADGAVSFDAANITSDGTGKLTLSALNVVGNPVTINGRASGTATLIEAFYGTFKLVLVSFNNFKNGGAAQTLALPTPFTLHCAFMTNASPILNLLVSGTAQSVAVVTGVSGSGDTTTSQTAINSSQLGSVVAAIDTVSDPGSSSSAHTGSILLWGV